MRKIKQYEFSIEIDEYIFNRFVKNKVRKPYNNFNTYKKAYPNCKCNFILRDRKEDSKRENKIYLWDISDRKAIGNSINK